MARVGKFPAGPEVVVWDHRRKNKDNVMISDMFLYLIMFTQGKLHIIIKNHGLLQSNKYNDFVLLWRNNATTSRHQRRQCVGRRRIRDGVPSLESRAFYR